MTAPTTRETADHVELTRLAEAATPGPWKSIIDDTGGERSGWPLCIVPENGDDRSVVRTGGMWPYEWDAKVSQHEAVSTAAFIAAANPATVLALLSEIAALRGDLTETRVAADLLVSSVRADLRQAERQRDELRKALVPIMEKLSDVFDCIRGDWSDPRSDCREGQDLVYQALTAIANQGAD